MLLLLFNLGCGVALIPACLGHVYSGGERLIIGVSKMDALLMEILSQQTQHERYAAISQDLIIFLVGVVIGLMIGGIIGFVIIGRDDE